MPIKLISLNLEGDKHYDRVFPFLLREQPDVVCFQEVFEADIHLIEALGLSLISFTALTTMTASQTHHSSKGAWGIATFANAELPLMDTKTVFYSGDSSSALQPFDGDHVTSTMKRAVQISTFADQDVKYTIANTHFTWTPDGIADDNQRKDQAKLIELLKSYREMLLCGDFNAPRGGEIYSNFCQQYADCLPPNITSTLDPVLHRYHNQVETVVDTIFSTPEYRINNVQAVQGLSDHKALVAVVDKASSTVASRI